MINKEVNALLAGRTVREPVDYDLKLQEFEAAKKQNGQKCYNVVKACSEALLLGIGNCYSKGMAYNGLRRTQPCGNPIAQTKLLITVLNGGKTLGSNVKFSRFYLIIDGTVDFPESVDLTDCFLKFQQAIKKAVTSTKAGEAGFKPLPEGSYFNALASIAESFKMIEEAINASGANSDQAKPFRVGVNCEADSQFNKDAKDPNKYEVEG